MFVTFWALEQAGCVTQGELHKYMEKINYGLLVGNHTGLGGNGLCCSSPGTTAGDGYGAGRTLNLKQHVHPWVILISCESLYWFLETMSRKRKILCYEPCLGLLCAAGHWVPTWRQGQWGSFWQTPEIFPPTVPLMSDSPPPAALGIRLSCDSEDPKKNLLSPI